MENISIFYTLGNLECEEKKNVQTQYYLAQMSNFMLQSSNKKQKYLTETFRYSDLTF